MIVLVRWPWVSVGVKAGVVAPCCVGGWGIWPFPYKCRRKKTPQDTYSCRTPYIFLHTQTSTIIHLTQASTWSEGADAVCGKASPEISLWAVSLCMVSILWWVGRGADEEDVGSWVGSTVMGVDGLLAEERFSALSEGERRREWRKKLTENERETRRNRKIEVCCGMKLLNIKNIITTKYLQMQYRNK